MAIHFDYGEEKPWGLQAAVEEEKRKKYEQDLVEQFRFDQDYVIKHSAEVAPILKRLATNERVYAGLKADAEKNPDNKTLQELIETRHQAILQDCDELGETTRRKAAAIKQARDILQAEGLYFDILENIVATRNQVKQTTVEQGREL